MAAESFFYLLLLHRFLFSGTFLSLAAAQDSDLVFRHVAGQDVTLPCQGPPAPPIALLDWSRPELKDDGYVFFYRDGKVYESYQHVLYRGRVGLVDPDMKGGNVSITVRNITANDSGVYECTMFLDTGPGQKPQVKHRLTLEVTEMLKNPTTAANDQPSRGVNVVVPVVVVLCVFLVIIGVLIYVWNKYKKSRSLESNGPENATLKDTSHQL